MTEEKLVRGIGRWDLTAIVINSIIGAGIFGLPSKVFAQIGSYSLYAFAACALIIGLIVLCHAEVGSRFSATGGAYLYAKEAFGPTAAFEVGWLYWIVRMATFAANVNLFVTYTGVFWPSAAAPMNRIVIIVAVLGLLTLINIVGVRQATIFTNVVTVGKLVPLLLFAVIGLFYLQPQNFNFDVVPQYTSFSSAVLILIYAFVGFEVAVIPAGEMKDPQKNLPFALFFALAAVTALYILVQIVSIGTLPGLATSERPLADAATGFIGPAGAMLIAAGALISILGNQNVGLLGGSRILYAMGERGELPAFLAKTSEKFRTPHVAILVNALIILVFATQTSFLGALGIATITRLMIFATTCLSLIVFRRRSDIPQAKFTAPFGVASAILSIALIVWLLTNVDFGKEGLPIIVVAAVGLILYLFYRYYRRSKTEIMKNKSICILVIGLCSLSAAAQSSIVPIVELKFRGLMGGVQNGKWIAAARVAPKLKKETEFVLVGRNGVEEGGVTMGKKGEKEDVCQDFTRFDFELEQDHGVAIGSTAKWNPVPRIPKPIDLNNATYKTVVANYLKKKGIAKTTIKLTEAFRVDLEGDGVEEIILAATYYKKGLDASAAVGDYSVVLVRKVVGKVVTDHMLTGDFILKKIDFGAPSEHHISAIADLNGDGKMEVVLYGFYYEGDFASAYEMRAGKPVMIKEFEIGCGV